jgi:hypothetical protein
MGTQFSSSGPQAASSTGGGLLSRVATPTPTVPTIRPIDISNSSPSKRIAGCLLGESYKRFLALTEATLNSKDKDGISLLQHLDELALSYRNHSDSKALRLLNAVVAELSMPECSSQGDKPHCFYESVSYYLKLTLPAQWARLVRDTFQSAEPRHFLLKDSGSYLDDALHLHLKDTLGLLNLAYGAASEVSKIHTSQHVELSVVPNEDSIKIIELVLRNQTEPLFALTKERKHAVVLLPSSKKGIVRVRDPQVAFANSEVPITEYIENNCSAILVTQQCLLAAFNHSIPALVSFFRKNARWGQNSVCVELISQSEAYQSLITSFRSDPDTHLFNLTFLFDMSIDREFRKSIVREFIQQRNFPLVRAQLCEIAATRTHYGEMVLNERILTNEELKSIVASLKSRGVSKQTVEHVRSYMTAC